MINKIVVTRLPKQKKQSNGSLVKEREKGKMELDLWQRLDRPKKIFLLPMLAPTLNVEKWFKQLAVREAAPTLIVEKRFK